MYLLSRQFLGLSNPGINVWSLRVFCDFKDEVACLLRVSLDLALDFVFWMDRDLLKDRLLDPYLSRTRLFSLVFFSKMLEKNSEVLYATISKSS